MVGGGLLDGSWVTPTIVGDRKGCGGWGERKQIRDGILPLGPWQRDACSSGSDCGWVDQVVWTPATNLPSSSLATALDTSLSILTGGHVDWSSTTLQPYYGSEYAQSGYPGYNQFSEMQTTVSGSGTLIFYWKISGEAN